MLPDEPNGPFKGVCKGTAMRRLSGCGASTRQAGVHKEAVAHLLVGLDVPDQVVQRVNALLHGECELVVLRAQEVRHLHAHQTAIAQQL